MKRQSAIKSRNHKRKGKWEGKPRENRPAFVPRQIVDRFMRIKGIAEVKPVTSERDELEIIVVTRHGYDHVTHEAFLLAYYEIEQSLKSRGQKFYASISW